MENRYEFIGNARVVKSLDELPRIGSKFKDLAIFDTYKDSYCISINAYEHDDIKREVKTGLSDEESEKYLYFEVYYTDRKGKYVYFGVDTFHFLYCILKENI